MIKIIGIPYEGPENFVKGTSLAPSRIRWAMDSIEDYSIYHKGVVPEYKDLGDIYPQYTENPEKTLKHIENELVKLDFKKDDRLIFLGGDHSITLPAFKAILKLHEDITLIHFDAHLDRRDRFWGNKYSHATVIKRIEELIGSEKIFTFGYRSKAVEEPETGVPYRIYEPLKELVEKINAPIYLTIDLDVLDPSEFPAVSNPEPRGVSFKELQESIGLLKGKLVAVDIVEFNPLSIPALYPAVTAALLLREIIFELAS